jgi:predicted ester cyclase
MNAVDPRQMYDRWMEMWNGKPELAAELVAPGCVVHQPPNDASGPEGVRAMVEMGRAPFEDITFRIEVEPIVEGDRLAARWSMTGHYRGGLPGATAEPGTEVSFGGIDIWRVEDGKIAEYWVSSDGLHLMAQLGAGQESGEAS